VIILFDEDLGTRVPDALRLVGYRRVISMKTQGWLSRDDVDWLTIAGRRGWIIFSNNKRMLTVPEEEQTIIREKVGIVFLTSGYEHVDKVLLLMLKKWTWFQHIDKNDNRPFVYMLSPRGKHIPKQLD
jgi:hypothetical protein